MITKRKPTSIFNKPRHWLKDFESGQKVNLDTKSVTRSFFVAKQRFSVAEQS